MDATDRQIRREIESAKLAILKEADPENGPRCPHCGEPTLTGKWRTSFEIRLAARGDESSGAVGLAMYELLDEGMFIQNAQLQIRLSAKGRRAAAKLL